jgi:branched-subunit amino acid ABC-type transport system permease component
VVAFVVMIVILLVRPQGIIGRGEAGHGGQGEE